MRLAKYQCGHRFMIHFGTGINLDHKFSCPGCRSKRPFTQETDKEAQQGKALGVSPDGCVHIKGTKHLSLRRHRMTRTSIRASKGKGNHALPALQGRR